MCAVLTAASDDSEVGMNASTHGVGQSRASTPATVGDSVKLSLYPDRQHRRLARCRASRDAVKTQYHSHAGRIVAIIRIDGCGEKDSVSANPTKTLLLRE